MRNLYADCRMLSSGKTVPVQLFSSSTSIKRIAYIVTLAVGCWEMGWLEEDYGTANLQRDMRRVRRTQQSESHSYLTPDCVCIHPVYDDARYRSRYARHRVTT